MASSKQYEWNDVTVVVLGKIVTGITAIEIELKQDKSPLYGRGNKPLAVQSGKKSYEGKLTFLQSEYAALAAAAKLANPAYDVTDIAFDITWNFTRTIDGKSETYNIKSAELTSAKLGIGSDDTTMEIELPFIALDLIAA